MFFSDDAENGVNKDNAVPVFIKNQPKNCNYPKRMQTEKELFYLNGLNRFPGFIT